MKKFSTILLVLLTVCLCQLHAATKGDLIRVGSIVYQVTDASKYTVSVYHVGSDVSGELTIPSSINDASGQAYSVTGTLLECLKDASVTKITLPSTLAETSKFDNSDDKGYQYGSLECPTLTEIAVDANNKVFKAVDGVMFNYRGSRLEAYPSNKATTEYTLPSSVAGVMPLAFSGARNLETLTIPKGFGQYNNEQSDANMGCWANILSLKKYIVEEGNSRYVTVDGILYYVATSGANKGKKALVSYPAARTDKSLTTADDVITLFPYSISGASNLEEINLNKIQYWSRPAIVNCRNVKTIKGTNSTFLQFKDNAVFTEKNMLYFAASGNGGTFMIPDGTTGLDKYSFGYSKFDKVIVPSSVEAIANYAFYGSDVKEVDLSQCKDTAVWQYTFANCANLRYLSFPSTVKFSQTSTKIDVVPARIVYGDSNLAYLDLSKTGLNIKSVNRNSGYLDGMDAHTLIFLPAKNTLTGENVVNTDADGNRTAESITLSSTATSFATPYAFTAKKLTFDRTFTANQYATLTLPFSLTADETAKLGKVYALNAPENSVEESEAFFDQTADAITANKPYLVLPSTSITSAFTKENVSIEATPTNVSEGFNPCFYATNESGDLGLNADFTTTTDPAFTSLSDGQIILPFHAYWKSSSFTNVPVVFDYITAKVGDTGYATLYYGDKALKIPNGVSALTIKLSNDEVTTSKEYTVGNVLPKATGVVLKAPAGTYRFAVSSETGTADESNLLSGSDEATNTTGPANAKFYLLAKSDDGVGFFYGAANGAAFLNGAHKAYLVVSGTSAAKPMYLFGKDGSTTKIRTINAIDGLNTPCYSLDGRRVSPNYKGIVILNRKKVINQ